MPDMNKVNILLVDDRPENLLVLEAILACEDYNLIKAASGDEALKYLLKHDFAAILLDVQMPDMDGFTTAKIIKARQKTANTPIIFITANYLDSKHILTGYELGAMDYILKPFDPLVLKAKVRGYAEVFKLNRKLAYQAEMLANKTEQLEKTCAELYQTTSDLLVSEALANVISETTIDSMIILDSKGSILKVNPAVHTMFQYERSEILGQDIRILFTSQEVLSFLERVLELAAKNEYLPNITYMEDVNAVRKDGTSFPAELQIGLKNVEGKCLIACTIRDITKKKQDAEAIRHMAYHDILTDLPNRRSFYDRLDAVLQSAKQKHEPFVLMYLDFDRFKYVNDSLGHNTGDKVLQEISRRLNACVREGDFIGRIGGDEFSIILPNTEREAAIVIAERILEHIQKPFFVDRYEINIAASIGFSVYPFDGNEPSQLMKNADAALYRAKEADKNQYKIFHTGMDLKSYRSFILQNDFRKAIEQQELFLVYQPRIDIKTGLITSVEALLRWKHPDLGLISPAEFIPLAEESGFIIKMGEWVLRSACDQYKAWQKAGISPVRIAVNFSAKQFLEKGLLAGMKQILNEAAVPPDMIEIEITESAILENEESVMNALNQINRMGVWISLDDFGTGYSSLNYLRLYPVNTIKIDKSFVQDLAADHPNTSTALVSAIISMSHSLKKTVVAEGVEQIEQYSTLRKYECDELQGFLFSPPVPAGDIEGMLLKNKAKAKLIMNTENVSLAAWNQSGNLQVSEKVIDLALQRTRKAYALSALEAQVFRMIVNGLSYKAISEQLGISEPDVKKLIYEILHKFHVNDRVEAIARVYQACVEVGNQFIFQ